MQGIRPALISRLPQPGTEIAPRQIETRFQMLIGIASRFGVRHAALRQLFRAPKIAPVHIDVAAVGRDIQPADRDFVLACAAVRFCFVEHSGGLIETRHRFLILSLHFVDTAQRQGSLPAGIQSRPACHAAKLFPRFPHTAHCHQRIAQTLPRSRFAFRIRRFLRECHRLRECIGGAGIIGSTQAGVAQPTLRPCLRRTVALLRGQ